MVSENGEEIFKVFFHETTDCLIIHAESEIETEIHPDIYQLRNDYDFTLPLKIEFLDNSFSGYVKGWFPNGQHDPAAILTSGCIGWYKK